MKEFINARIWLLTRWKKYGIIITQFDVYISIRRREMM